MKSLLFLHSKRLNPRFFCAQEVYQPLHGSIFNGALMENHYEWSEVPTDVFTSKSYAGREKGG